jgi:hypothetical protein
MKRTLWTFGDSFTESYSDNSAMWLDRYIDWKGYIPKVYGEVISEKLELELINMGRGGADNYSIFQRICDAANKIKPNDIVIIGWSNAVRFRVASDVGKWYAIVTNYRENNVPHDLSNVSDTTLNEIIVNRASVLFLDEICSWIKLLDYTFSNNTIIHWSPFHSNISKYNIDCRKCETIDTETNGEIVDGHYSEAGHVILSEFLIQIINNPNRKKML